MDKLIIMLVLRSDLKKEKKKKDYFWCTKYGLLESKLERCFFITKEKEKM